MSIEILPISDDSFEDEVINSTMPVLVDFWAPWCGPCKALAPTLEEAYKETNDRVKFVKLDIVDNPLTAPKFGVRGIPTLILFKNGQVISTHVGGDITKSGLIKFIDDNI